MRNLLLANSTAWNWRAFHEGESRFLGSRRGSWTCEALQAFQELRVECGVGPELPGNPRLKKTPKQPEHPRHLMNIP